MSSEVDNVSTRSGSEGSSGQLESDRRWTAKRIAVGVIVAVVALFAIVNTRGVKVEWILGSPIKTPLIVVIVLSVAIGIAIGYLFAKFRGRGRSLKE